MRGTRSSRANERPPRMNAPLPVSIARHHCQPAALELVVPSELSVQASGEVLFVARRHAEPSCALVAHLYCSPMRPCTSNASGPPFQRMDPCSKSLRRTPEAVPACWLEGSSAPRGSVRFQYFSQIAPYTTKERLTVGKLRGYSSAVEKREDRLKPAVHCARIPFRQCRSRGGRHALQL